MSTWMSATGIGDAVLVIPFDGLLHPLATGYDPRIPGVRWPWVDNVSHHIGLDGVAGAGRHRVLSIEILRAGRWQQRAERNHYVKERLHPLHASFSLAPWLPAQQPEPVQWAQGREPGPAH